VVIERDKESPKGGYSARSYRRPDTPSLRTWFLIYVG
jgi:hypothetical protein